MPIVTHLAIQNLRIITNVAVNLAPQANLFTGPNASGKTTVLEALYILARGRSFRETQWTAIIAERRESLRVFARVFDQGQTVPVGIEHDRHQAVIRIKGQTQRNTKTLLEQLPVQLIAPDSHRLIEQGPQYRRQYLDWGVFHVEQRFLGAWQRYRRALKQRNAALKSSAKDAVLGPWEQEMSSAAEEIDRYRAHYVETLSPHLDDLGRELLKLDNLGVRYLRGWRDGDLATQLAASRTSDAQQGYTRAGPHRADLELSIGTHRAVQRISRGQQKALVFALTLAQARLLNERVNRNPILLVDDFGAELDDHHLKRIWSVLQEIKSQVLLTGTDLGDRLATQTPEDALFHVERGEVTPVL